MKQSGTKITYHQFRSLEMQLATVAKIAFKLSNNVEIPTLTNEIIISFTKNNEISVVPACRSCKPGVV